MLSTSKNVLFPVPPANHRCWWPFTCWRSGDNQSVGSSARWLTGGYDLEIGHVFEVDSMVISWWIVAFCAVILWPVLCKHCLGCQYLHQYIRKIHTAENLLHQFYYDLQHLTQILSAYNKGKSSWYKMYSIISLWLPRLPKLPCPFEQHWQGKLANLGSNKEI